MRCDEVTALLPALVDGEPVGFEAERHVETCLRCQAELARYRRLLRTLSMLRTRYAEPTPGSARRDARRDHRRGRARCAPHAVVGPPARVRRCDRRQRARGRGDGRGPDRPFPQTGPQPRRVIRRRRRRRLGRRRRSRCYPSRLAPTARRAVAQLVEHRSPKPAVGGSSPSCPARYPNSSPNS